LNKFCVHGILNQSKSQKVILRLFLLKRAKKIKQAILLVRSHQKGGVWNYNSNYSN